MLTTTQLAALAADIRNDPVLSLLTPSAVNSTTISDAYNELANPAAPVWDADVPVDRIHDAIDYTKYTPIVTPDTTVQYTNYVLSIQTKQFNLQTMLMGRTSIDGRKASVRNGLKDATTQIPAGSAWGNVNPGGLSGVNVLGAMLRATNATRAEKLFSMGTATTGSTTAEILGFEGSLTRDDVEQALGW